MPKLHEVNYSENLIELLTPSVQEKFEMMSVRQTEETFLKKKVSNDDVITSDHLFKKRGKK